LKIKCIVVFITHKVLIDPNIQIGPSSIGLKCTVLPALQVVLPLPVIAIEFVIETKSVMFLSLYVVKQLK
jgi:hypothetical protein